MRSDPKSASHVLRAKVPFDSGHEDDARFLSLMGRLGDGEMPRLLRHLLLKAMPADEQAFERARAEALKEQQERGIQRGRPKGAKGKKKAASSPKSDAVIAARSDAVAEVREEASESTGAAVSEEGNHTVPLPQAASAGAAASLMKFKGLLGGSKTW